MTQPKHSPAAVLDVKCSHCGDIAQRQEDDALRCACGSLLARYVPGGIELKCRRCKRFVTVPDQSAAHSDMAAE